MQWLSLRPTLEPLVGDVPELLGTALALSDVANYESYLIDEEVTEHAAMGAMRKLSFSIKTNNSIVSESIFSPRKNIIL